MEDSQTHTHTNARDRAVGSARGEIRTAAELAVGECGVVCGVDVGAIELERLQMMGLCLGRRVRVVKAGDPMIVSVMGSRIALARALARRIVLNLQQAPCRSAAAQARE